MREILDEFYPNSPAENDPWRIRADGPWPMPAEEAVDYLKEQVKDRFRDMDEWQVDWREVRGVRGIRVLWGWGPCWLPMRAFCDNFAAVHLEGLYAPVEAAGAQPLADYIYVVKHKGTDVVPWLDWGFSEGVES